MNRSTWNTGICVLLTIFLVVMTMGCASSPKTLNPNYAAYQQAKLTQPALVDIRWSDDGQRIKQLTVNAPMDIQQKQPDAPHPAWGVVNSLVRVGGIVGGIWAAGDAMEGVIGASRGSYTSGGDMAVSGSSVANPISTTTTTETTTTNTETTGASEVPTEVPTGTTPTSSETSWE